MTTGSGLMRATANGAVAFDAAIRQTVRPRGDAILPGVRREDGPAPD